MTIKQADRDPPSLARFRRRLDLPVSSAFCATSWVVATAIFVGLSLLLGGPSESDVALGVYGTWSVEHGNLACAFPNSAVHGINDLANPFAVAAPLYSLVSGGVAALLRIGHSIPFPTSLQLGAHCSNAVQAMFDWSVSSDAIIPTIRLGYLIWPALMFGAVALLRSSGRGRRGWEPLTLFLLACTPPVLMCLTYFFHPQDVLAMGLVLGGVACFLKKRWVLAGVLLGLAVCSQQYAVLVGAALIVAAPCRMAKVKLGAGALLSVTIVDLSVILATSGRAVKAVFLGSSLVGGNFRSAGGTILWETRVSGLPLFVISRLAPVVVVIAIAWWLARRLGPKLLEPVPLMSLVATSLSVRLMFEENLFGYYFMSVAVALVLLDVVGGRLRGQVLAWIGLVTLAFNPEHLGLLSNLTNWASGLSAGIPIFLLALSLSSVALDAYRKTYRLYKLVWIVVVSLTCEYTIFGRVRPLVHVPHWLWQVVLVTTAAALAMDPLFEHFRSADVEKGLASDVTTFHRAFDSGRYTD